MKKIIHVKCSSGSKNADWNKGIDIAKKMYIHHKPLMEALKNK